MCRYCEFDLIQEPFTEKEIFRGDLFLHELDSDMYIERDYCEIEMQQYFGYILVTQLSNRKKIEDEIRFCPKCGRELPTK